MPKRTLAIAIVGIAASVLQAADFPSHTISNGQIKAKIYLPDAQSGFYRSTRFDWSGVVGSLEYKGHNYYGQWFTKITDVFDFGYEGDDVISAAFTAMVGPGEEYGVIGYNDVKAGGTFLKPGVGMLRRVDDTPYSHSKPYEIVDGGKWSVKKSGDAVEFTQTLNDAASGYGYVYTKVVRLTKGKPQMTIGHTLRNTGTKAIQTNVYNHNFLVLDKQAPGPDFEISFPFQLQARQQPNKELGEIRGNRIAYVKTLEKQDRLSTSVTGFSDSAKDYDIRVENKKAGAGVHITGDRPLTRIGYWSIKTVLAVEPYHDVVVEPGKETAWTYTYDYYTTGDGGKAL
ncbi:MAG: hypothetical protein ABI759_14915 [Candidatus Solibacter sp.]